jgi:hypothetical protein
VQPGEERDEQRPTWPKSDESWLATVRCLARESNDEDDEFADSDLDEYIAGGLPDHEYEDEELDRFLPEILYEYEHQDELGFDEEYDYDHDADSQYYEAW